MLRVAPSSTFAKPPGLFHGSPWLVLTDSRAGHLLQGFGDSSARRFAFVPASALAVDASPHASEVAPDVVLIGVDEGAHNPPLPLLPLAIRHQRNLTALLAVEGALGDLLASQLTSLGLKVQRCELSDLTANLDPPALDVGKASPKASSPSPQPEPNMTPSLALSVGLGRSWCGKDGSIKKDKSGRDITLDLEKVKPWTGTPRELHALLNSHRHTSTNKGCKYKVGHFIVGAVFAVTEEHPTGHRHRDSLQHATLVILDIDDAPNLTRAALEAQLRSLGVGFIFYSTWSNARAGSGKTGLCARVVFWLARPLTAPDGLPQVQRVHLIGQQLASIVRHISALLGVDAVKAVDSVSKRPHQLMYTPRTHAPKHSGAGEWWCELHDGPALSLDALPGGVSLADLLTVEDTPASPTCTTPAPASSPLPHRPPLTAPHHSDAHQRARALAYIQKCADDLSTFTEGRYTHIVEKIGSPCGSVASGHGLTEAEGLQPLETVVSAWGCPSFTKTLRATFAHGYRDPRTLPDNPPPSKGARRTEPRNDPAPPPQPSPLAVGGQAPPSYPPSQDLNPTPPYVEDAAPPTAPRIDPGNASLGICLALPRRFDLLRREPPDARPPLACVKTPEDVDALAANTHHGERVILGIPPTHPLYPHAFNTFRAKGCDIRCI